MKATTRNMAEAITQALGPIFHSNPDYKTICEAMALTMARVAQSTPDKGSEEKELDRMMEMADVALNEFLNEEEALQEAKQSTMAKGIDAFAEMARSHEGYGPAYPLAALHGDLGVEARDAAEEFAGQDHTEVERPAFQPFHDEKGRLTPAGFEQLKKDVIALHTPDHDQWGDGGPMAAKHLDPKDDELEGPEHTKASWSNSPIHQEIARFEQEHPNRDDGYNPDGPRAYAP